MLTCPHGHYEVWEEWRRRGDNCLVAESEYEEWPRGRVVYDTVNGRFVLYADPQIFRRPDLIARVREIFALPDVQTDPKPDSHYRSTRRIGQSDAKI